MPVRARAAAGDPAGSGCMYALVGVCYAQTGEQPFSGAAVITRLVALALLVLLTRPAAAGEITECRQVVPRGVGGELRRDLDCAAAPLGAVGREGVRLERGDTLEMNGFAIRGDGTGVGIGCFGAGPHHRCEVNGPGTVSGFEAGINGASCKLVLRGILLEGNGDGVL